MNQEKVRISVQLERPVVEILDRQAKADHRQRASYIRKVLATHVTKVKEGAQ